VSGPRVVPSGVNIAGDSDAWRYSSQPSVRLAPDGNPRVVTADGGEFRRVLGSRDDVPRVATGHPVGQVGGRQQRR
jgi:hypothetical protein